MARALGASRKGTGHCLSSRSLDTISSVIKILLALRQLCLLLCKRHLCDNTWPVEHSLLLAKEAFGVYCLGRSSRLIAAPELPHQEGFDQEAGEDALVGNRLLRGKDSMHTVQPHGVGRRRAFLGAQDDLVCGDLERGERQIAGLDKVRRHGGLQ
jgi:hypothetical protein